MYAGHHYELGKITRLQQSCEAISGRRERFYPKKFIFSGSKMTGFRKFIIRQRPASFFFSFFFFFRKPGIEHSPQGQEAVKGCKSFQHLLFPL